MTVIPCPPYSPDLVLVTLFSQLNIKPKGRQFDTTEVIEVESQVVPNTLTEHNFQAAFKKW
jgi:hypothetical protein